MIIRGRQAEGGEVIPSLVYLGAKFSNKSEVRFIN